ncbi:MAG: hypothetical protein JO139_12410 [Alphaproteobacteria bacterium]|nr:hypothetical protein [Alphaproteobacteria bacterium]
MADIETSVIISAQTDDLQSAMEAASNSVQAATDAMRAQFAGLGAAAQQVQTQISSAAAQVGSSIGALQSKAASLAGSLDVAPGGYSARALAAPDERDQLNRLNAEQKITDEQFARYRAEVENEASLGQLSTAELIRQEQDLLDLKWSYDQGYYEKKQAAAENDARTQEKLVDEQALAYEKYVTNVEALDAKLAEANKRAWDDLVAPIERAIDKSVTGIILGTTTVQKALANLAQSIIAEFVNSAVKGIFSQIGNLFGAGLLGGGGDQEFSGGLTGAGEEVLGGGVAASLALGNLFGSGGIFGSLFKGIGALFGFERGGIVPSAQGGWAVPSLGPGGVLAQLHSNEMVLPANISQGLQNLIAAPSGANAAGGAPVIVNFGVSAMDSQDVARFFRSNGSALVAAINNAMRNGSMLRAS